MKVITCAGYYRTGSTAVTDFLSEFDGCRSLGNFEFRFLQDPDGVSSLETNIIEHPHRHNTSHAIKRFIKYSRFENGNILSKRYRRFFGRDYWKYTMQYVNTITKVKCDSVWRYDKIEKGELFYMLSKMIETVTEKLTNGKRITLQKLWHEKGYYTDISREDFYRATKIYTRKLFSSVSAGCDYLMVDQLAAPMNAQRYLNYVDDLYIVIVDRDPRDLFILESEAKWGVIPYKSVEEFCKWYRITRKHRKTDQNDPSKILYVQFEDMIYHYEETGKKIMNLVGLTEEQHVRPQTCFDPAKSISGTNLVNVYTKYKKQVEYIEKHLPEYLYDYSGCEINTAKPTVWNR